MHIENKCVWDTQHVGFLNASIKSTLEEEVYVKITAMFSDGNSNIEETAVIKLNKSLYGIVQAPRT